MLDALVYGEAPQSFVARGVDARGKGEKHARGTSNTLKR